MGYISFNKSILRKWKRAGGKVFFFLLILGSMSMAYPPWGFYAHRWINRMAVFTLPSDMIGIFKEQIEFITEHAVDPDKRRYATKYEAVRHYIDIDHWDAYPFEDVPRKWIDAISQNLQFVCISETGDTIQLYESKPKFWGKSNSNKRSGESYQLLKEFTKGHLLPIYYEDEWLVSKDSIATYLSEARDWPCETVHVFEKFSEYGILPYHLLVMQNRLTSAFATKNLKRILRLSAEMGHYIGDAHVPLHTTENYNGQLTGQEGIHALWESRIPELFAEGNYDFWVGQASYIDDPGTFFWNIVLESHQLVPVVLEKEMRLRSEFPSDQQFCFDERLGLTILTQCEQFAAAYQESLDGMVEDRMAATVKALGDAWYTAWIDAGQPNLNQLKENLELTDKEIIARQDIEEQYRKGEAKGRKHENN